MTSILTTLPSWFLMVLIGSLAIAIIYRLVRYGIKVKTPIIEIDATDEEDNTNDKI